MLRASLLAILSLLVASAHAQETPAPPAPTAPAALSPVKILLTMKKVYAECRSYRDTGAVRTSSVTEETRFGGKTPFTTAFVRPGPFRFEFTDTGLGDRESKVVLWWNGAEVHSWWDTQPGEHLSDSLKQALEAAAGISAGASLRVPGMLLPAIVGADAPLVAPERLADAADRGVWCFRLVGKSRATPYTQTTGTITVTVQDESVTLWIDRATFLLRKIEDVKTMSTYRMTRTTTYTPEIDVDLPPEQLAPPAK
jgi:hypothetical protein